MSSFKTVETFKQTQKNVSLSKAGFFHSYVELHNNSIELQNPFCQTLFSEGKNNQNVALLVQ